MELFIKETAKKYGISLTQLASIMGVNRQTIYFYIEQGAKNPLCQIEKIAKAIGCSIEELYNGECCNSAGLTCPHCGKPLSIKIE